MNELFARWSPHALAAVLCGGLALALVARVPSAAVAVAAAVLAVGAAVAARWWRSALLATSLLLLGWSWASARLESLDRSSLVRDVGRSASARVVVTGPLRRGRFDLRGPADVRRFGRVVVDEPVLLRLPLGRSPPQGAVLEIVGKIEAPHGPRDGFDEREWLRRRGVQVVLRANHARVVGRRGGVAGYADRLRHRLARTIAPGLDGERRAVVAGIVLGEDEGLSDDLRDAFRASGLYHLLAVSGQNVAFLALGIFGLAWLLGVPRVFAELSILLAIVGYVAAVGWQPSVVRAGIAGALASLAWLTARPRDRWYAFLLGAIVLLTWNPYSLLEPGFQLSFAAVAAIFVLVPRVDRRLEGYPLPPGLRPVISVSVACSLATAPLVWAHFHALPIFSVLANVFAVPVAGPLLGLGLIAAAVEPVAPPLASSIAWTNGWFAAYLAACARIVAALPHAQLTSGLAVALLTAAVALALTWRRLPPSLRLPIAAPAVVAFVVGLALWLVPSAPPAPSGVRITFLDVGQGDAVLLQTRNAAVLVDQGPPEGEVAAQLRRLGIRRLSLLVLTHPQRDHVGGAAEVLRKTEVDAVLDPRLMVSGPEQREALAEARERRLPVLLARAGAVYRLGALRLRVLWPARAGFRGQDPNALATVLLASYGELDVLLTADAESEVTAPLRPPPAEVLKVAHHGSADPLLAELLRRVRPRVAVISVGEGNDYGHPARSTLSALEDFDGLRVLRTDLDGRVTVESDGRRLEVRTSGA